jgi:hypothetical protein
MDILKRIDRYRALCLGHGSGVCVVTSFPDRTLGEDLRTFDFNRPAEHRRYWDRLIQTINRRIEIRQNVDDDWIPGITLHYGFGAFGAIFCDETLAFTEDTSYLPHQVLEDWNKACQCRYRKDRFWSEMFLGAAEYISTRAGSSFMTEVYPTPGPLDVANLLRGNAVFTDVYEYPEQLHAFLSAAADDLVEHTLNLRKVMQNPLDAVFTFDKCIPGGVLLLEDAADLCSPGTYNQFGRPYTQRVIDRLGGAYIHHHSLGRQQFKTIDRLAGLWVHQISSDPNCVRPITDLDFLLGQVTGNPVVDLECTFAEIRQYYHRLKGGKYILTVNCQDETEAKRTVEFVRQHCGVPV